MEIKHDKPVMIFKNEKGFYSVGLSKKNKDNSYTNGYMNCQFKNEVSLENKTKVNIKEAWLSFYLKDKITVPYIFINEFDIVEEIKDEPKEENPFEQFSEKVESDIGQQIEITDEDLPF